MVGRDRLLETLESCRRRHAALPGIRVHTIVEAEAALEAASGRAEPVLFMVSVARARLGPFIRALRGLADSVAVQLAGEEPEPLARAAIELQADAAYLVSEVSGASEALARGVAGRNVLTEIVLPWQQTAPGAGAEGRIVDVEAARAVLERAGIDVAAVPVGGGPGPYKTWRIPLWSPEVFTRVVALRENMHYSLPWGSLITKSLLQKYNQYGGALPGVVSLPSHQLRPFLAAGAVKVSFRSDCALAFLGGLRESLFLRPEAIDVSLHFTAACDELTGFWRERLEELTP
jgi:fructose/tagatose bisphosphate aldolase